MLRWFSSGARKRQLIEPTNPWPRSPGKTKTLECGCIDVCTDQRPGHPSTGPSEQHRAECDCNEFHNGKCIWPMCEVTRGFYSTTGELKKVSIMATCPICHRFTTVRFASFNITNAITRLTTVVATIRMKLSRCWNSGSHLMNT
jgi:hypothetical protein